MVTAVCVECGKEYELEPGQNPADFQCKCGGDLRTLSSEETLEKNQSQIGNIKDISEGTSYGTSLNWFNKQQGIVKASIVIGVCGFVLFLSFFYLLFFMVRLV